ncbi:hypothetical protein HZS_2787 [Henneguya salminicola]|nr:hypothetical protein HZS_2787 [Henneguya salminicola]
METKAYNGFLYTRNTIHPTVVHYRCSTFKRTKCPGKLILKKDKTEIKGIHTCGSNMQIIGKTIEFSKKDQNPSNFIQKHLRNNAETLEKMPFKVDKELLINMRKTFSGKIYRILQKYEVYNVLRQRTYSSKRYCQNLGCFNEKPF